MPTNSDKGIYFEQSIKNILISCGCTVFETPSSNDYGADLIVNYFEHTLAIQCKFYSKPVGIKAVQEIIASQKYYSATLLMVITNSTFTQQAYSLAQTNNVLLIDGTTINTISADQYGHILILDQFINSNVPAAQEIDNDLTLNDLVIRYGLSKDQITRYCFSMGLPYYRIGRQYHIRYDELVQWEIDTKVIMYGRKNYLYLPGWLLEMEQVKTALSEYKKKGHMQKYRELKKYYKKIKLPVHWKRTVFALLFFMVVLVFFVYISYHFMLPYLR